MAILFIALGLVVAGLLVALFVAFLPSAALGTIEKKIAAGDATNASPPETNSPGDGGTGSETRSSDSR